MVGSPQIGGHLSILGARVGQRVTNFWCTRLGMARLGSRDDPFDAWRADGMTNTGDALVVSTSPFERCPVVTNDKRFRGRANRSVEAITPAEALRRLGFSPVL